MAWIKSKCGKFELEFKNLKPEDMSEGWEADPNNLPNGARRLKETSKAEAKEEPKAEEPKKEEPKEEAPRSEKKRGRPRKKKEEDKDEDQ